jgi:hypothetical protein
VIGLLLIVADVCRIMSQSSSASAIKYRVSEKYGTNGNFNNFFIFIYRLELKVKMVKMY